MHILFHVTCILHPKRVSLLHLSQGNTEKKKTRPVPKAFARPLQSAGTDAVAPHVVTIHGYAGF